LRNREGAKVLERISNGRTDLVFEWVAQGNAATGKHDGVSLIESCAYYGDVSAIKFLLSHGESLNSLGSDFGLGAAAFHSHWRLCEFLLESGADANSASTHTGETPLHSALCANTRETAADLVVRVLLSHGADPNSKTLPGKETGGFMRDVRTRAETPLHRAAAFADESTIQLLLDAGAVVEAKDVNGDSPLTWASWYLRPTAVLLKLCYGNFRVNPARQSMEDYLQGKPTCSKKL
jgi:ankyrin repeat protein